MKMSRIRAFIGLGLLFISTLSLAKEPELTPLRIAVLKFGTVNWVLNVIKHHGLDKKHGIDLKVVPLGSKNASHVAIQGGAADMIVSDWIWVSRQRAEHRDYTFVPYSNATGSLMVKKNSGIDKLSDLQGKKLGIAGGPVDKSWLFLRAYSQQKLGKDFAEIVETNFVAPPLLNKLAQRGQLDAGLNFWHYSARLKASGFKPLITLPEILQALGVERTIPVIGWVFSEGWADENTDLVKSFLAAEQDAKKLLLKSDQEWLRVKPKMKAKNEVMFTTLRDAFRAGVPRCFGDEEKQASKSAFAILAKLGGEKLVGSSSQLEEGSFWKKYHSKACKKVK